MNEHAWARQRLIDLQNERYPSPRILLAERYDVCPVCGRPQDTDHQLLIIGPAEATLTDPAPDRRVAFWHTQIVRMRERAGCYSDTQVYTDPFLDGQILLLEARVLHVEAGR